MTRKLCLNTAFSAVKINVDAWQRAFQAGGASVPCVIMTFLTGALPIAPLELSNPPKNRHHLVEWKVQRRLLRESKSLIQRRLQVGLPHLPFVS